MFPTDQLPLRGRTALVTGVSRRRGIGFAVAGRFAALGADVFIHHYSAHDTPQPWGGDDLDLVRSELRSALTEGARIGDVDADLRDPDAIEGVIAAARELTGRLDILVCNHARSGGDGSLLDMTADSLDAFWTANGPSTLLPPARSQPSTREPPRGPVRASGSVAPSRSRHRSGACSG